MKKIFWGLTFNLLFIGAMFGQNNPVKWEVTMEGDDSHRAVVFRATIQDGWHIYSLDENNPGPTTFTFEELQHASLNGDLTPSRVADKRIDEYFGAIEEYSNTVEFKQPILLDDLDNYQIAGEISYQACTDQTCQRLTHPFALGGNKVATAPVPVKLNLGALKQIEPRQQETASLTGQPGWQPVKVEQKSRSLWGIFLSGFIGGLLALLTPCVWPMIPLTVSFFLKKKQTRAKAIKESLLYGLSIIVIYLGLGLLITLIFGASALNQLATNAVFNVLFFLLLVIFAISFFGAFEITLPASWSNKLDKKADTATGVLAIFFMAFTLALVSFSCTGPIIGTLLVETASWGSTLAPAIGMGGFAIALAIPFALFAMFPSLMKQMPKSGGWLNTVKVVLGFLELALSLKFLSVADLAYGWGILDRETFLVLWIVIFALLGFYLLGKLHFAHDSRLEYISVTRLFLAIISFAFALYMVPGLWGAPTKAISAFAPPMYTQDFNLARHEEHTVFDNYDEALAYAQKENKPLLIDFSGYGCVNCRKMEATVLSDPTVKQIIGSQYIFVSLMVDDRTPLQEPLSVTVNGETKKLKTIGDKWAFLQSYKFGAVAQPYYAIVDSEGNLLVPPYDNGYDESISKFVNFLDNGLKEFNQ